jgi:hypothetical protein
LILFVGSAWVEESKERPELRRVVVREGGGGQGQAPSHVVDLLGGISGTLEGPGEGEGEGQVVDMSVYLAEKIGGVGGLYWASGLLQVCHLGPRKKKSEFLIFGTCNFCLEFGSVLIFKFSFFSAEYGVHKRQLVCESGGFRRFHIHGI